MKKNTSKKHTRKPVLVDPEWIKLSNAISVILTSDATPAGLHDVVIDFLNAEAGDLFGRLIKTPEMIQKILVQASIKEEADEQETAERYQRNVKTADALWPEEAPAN